MKKQILLICLVAIMGQVGFAQSIFTNPITDTNPSASNPYTNGQTVDPNMTVTGIGRGSGISASSASNRYSAAGWETAASINLNDYFTFTLTPNTNKNIDLASFTYTGTASGSGPVLFAFRSSLDNYTSDIGSPTEGGTTIDLSGAQFQNITGAIEFRFYAWDSNAAGGTFSINDFTFAGALPVTLISFEATTDQKTTELRFTTATEQNNDRFEIEYSIDGSLFKKIGEVKGAGTTLAMQHYSFTHDSPKQGNNYYRFRQVDFDGQFTHSPVRSITIGTTKAVKLFPTPVAESMNVQLDQPYADDAQWQVLDMTGRVVSEGVFAAEQVQFAIPVTTLTEGAYVMRITAGNEVVAKQFRKQ